MTINYKILIFAILFLLLPGISSAQKSNMIFHYLTTGDGLSSNGATCILRDSRDYVWIGTADDGLNRYNSIQIKVYRNDPKNPKSLSGDRIRCISEDAEKQIWVGTSDGLNLYVPDDDSFLSFRNTPSDTNSISNNNVNCIFKDKQDNLWIGTDGLNGLNKWNPKSSTFTHCPVFDRESNVRFNIITSITQDKDGNIWLSSHGNNGIMRFDPDKVEFTFFTNTSLRLSIGDEKLFVDDDIIWISTFGSGLFSFDTSTNNFTQYNSQGDGKGTNGKIITNIIQEDSDNLLIGVDQGGLNRYNKDTKTFEYIMFKQNSINNLNNNGIWCIYKDSEGIIWVGTSAGGVNFNNPKSEKFKHFRCIPGEPNSLIYNVVNSIFEDSKGLIWINTDGGGISVYNPQTGNFKNYKKEPNDPSSLPCNVIRQTVEDWVHDYWMGTWDGGYIKLDHKTGNFTQYSPESPKPFNLSGRTVWHNIVDSKGMMWLSIFGNGIDLFDRDKGIVKRFRHDPAINGTLSDDGVNFLFKDSHSNIWACTTDGLNLFDTLTNSFKVFRIFPEDDIRSIAEDKEGCYWAATLKKGISRFKSDGTVIKTYDTSNGLPDNTVNGMLEDSNNNLWFSTNEGISRLNYKTNEIRNFLTGDGLQEKGFLRHSFLKTRSGEMFFGGSGGLNSFYPDNLKDNTVIPRIYIDQFQLFNKVIAVGQLNSPLHKVIEQTKEIVLSWKESVFSFGFVAVNYTHPEKNRYAYKMEGFDKDWNYTDANRRLATYTNLDAGEYTFRVKASNNDGLWNETETSIKVTILPPWWLTWWFKLFVVLFILSASFGFYFYRVNALKKQKRILEIEVELKTKEIQDKNFELQEHAEKLNLINYTLIENQQRIERQAEELNNSLAITKATLESIHNGILAVNEQGAVVKTNARFAEMWNIPDDITASGDDKILMESVLEQLADGDGFITTIMELYRTPEAESFDLIDFKDGRTFERVSKPMHIGSKPKGRVWSFLDITNRKQAEAEIKLKNEQLLELNATKDKFFSIIAHDLRSPFNSFLGLTEIMAEELPSLTMSQIQEFSVNMRNSATNLYRLLENLLQWSKMQQGSIPYNPELLQLLQVVDECITMVFEQAKNKGIDITYDISADLKVFADNNILQTIIRNLVSNAMKFTPKGGKVSVSAKVTGEKDIEICIKDTGIGMTNEMVSNLFRLDVKTNREGTEGEPSSGLGLLLCKEFVEKLGGRIWVESEVRIGSVFYFTIPYNVGSEEKTAIKNAVSGDEVQPQIKPLKILIAEDDENSAVLIAMIVKKFSKEVLYARTGDKAVAICRNNPDIDLVLMDIEMSVLDGCEASRQIRQFNKDVVIIVQTAYALIGDREKAIGAGCNDYISKPIENKKLIKMILQHFEQ